MNALRAAPGDATPAGARRVAFVVRNMNIGGVQRVRLLLAAEFLRLGWAVDFVLLTASGELLSRIPPGCGVVDLGAHRIFAALPRLRRYLARVQPDLAIASIWPVTSVAAAAASLAAFRGVLVLSEHSTLSLSPIGRGFDGMMLRACMRRLNPRRGVLVAVSDGVRDDLIALGADADRVHTIHNPVAMADGVESPVALPAVWRDRPRARRFLAVGRIKDAKDYPMMVEAMRRVVDDGIDAGLAIAGDGTDRRKLEAVIAAAGPDVAERVELLGDVADPSSLYAAAGLLLFSSKFEGFGNVLVEAMAHGVPVVSTDCRSGPREILEGGRYGELVPVGDAGAFAAAIGRALNGTHDPEALASRARDFLPATVARRYVALFEAERDRRRTDREGVR